MLLTTILKSILALIIIYLVVLGAFYLFQRQVIYQPKSGEINPKKFRFTKVELVHLKTQDGLTLNAWYAPAKMHKATLLYFHGNYGHLSDRAGRINSYIEAGYGVLLLGYRGYSGNRGWPSEQGLYKDARAALQFLKQQKVSNQCIVLYGASLGSGIAVQMATEVHVGAVVLQTPFTSMIDVGKTHYPLFPVKTFLHDKYESDKKIQKIKTPLLIIHGEYDYIIPLKLGKKLYQLANQPKELRIVPRVGHNTLPDVSHTVIEFMEKYKICQPK